MAVDGAIQCIAAGKAGIDQFAAGEHTNGCFRHMRQNAKFRQRQRQAGNRIVGSEHASVMTILVHLHRPYAQDAAGAIPAGPAQHGARSGNDFHRVEGFDDIVIGSDAQCLKLVNVLIQSRHHDDWCGIRSANLR